MAVIVWLIVNELSHPSRGAWIEMSIRPPPDGEASGRTPHGVRGLKSELLARFDAGEMSHPSRGAWIEIAACRQRPRGPGRTPHGVRGLKSFCRRRRATRLSRTPHGVRGLKLALGPDRANGRAGGRTPHGVRGLKSPGQSPFEIPLHASHPSRGAWIEMPSSVSCRVCRSSHPSRGAWIEISGTPGGCGRRTVAPLTGCVD